MDVVFVFSLFRPQSDREKPLKILLFDSSYDKFKGVSANVAVIDGAVRKGNIYFLLKGKNNNSVCFIKVLEMIIIPGNLGSVQPLFRFNAKLCSYFVGDKIVAAHSKKPYEVQEIGIMFPSESRTDML